MKKFKFILIILIKILFLNGQINHKNNKIIAEIYMKLFSFHMMTINSVTFIKTKLLICNCNLEIQFIIFKQFIQIQ